MIQALIPVIGGLIGKAIDRGIPDKDKAEETKAMVISSLASLSASDLKEAASIIVAEAQSGHWLAANWRPITMLTFVVIIANNYILYPYLSLFFDSTPKLEIPPDMWGLLKIGLGGYVVGRSGEKIAKIWKEG